MATNTAISLSERFETAFNRIHKALMQNVRNADTDKFTDLVYKGKSHAIIRYYEHDLCQYAKLRNSIVHEKIEKDYYIAEPHKDVVEKIERIADEFEKPQTALSISNKPVCFFYENDKLTDLLKIIDEQGHSRFPVYREDDSFGWLLTSAEIVKWFAGRYAPEKMSLGDIRIKELYDKTCKHEVAFVSQDATALDVEDLYEEYRRKKAKLEAVLITRNGKPEETPNGIITTLDLLEVEIQE